MTNTQKSLTEYILDENHFKDFEYEFDYCIIHQENDTSIMKLPDCKNDNFLYMKN